MTAAKETRHWNPEAHIGDDGYVLADVKAAVAEATAGTTGEQEMRRRGANAPRPAQRGANAPRPAQRGANARRAAHVARAESSFKMAIELEDDDPFQTPKPKREATSSRQAPSGAAGGSSESQGHIFPWRCRISASPTRISTYGGKSSSL
eukprot:jgi/Tetstr1/424744/TSEL_015261.t1